MEAALRRKKRTTRIAYRYPREKPKQPTAVIKRAIVDSSVHRIMCVSSKTDVFRRDLRICGLQSTTRATDQKVNFLINPQKVSLNKLNFLGRYKLRSDVKQIGSPSYNCNDFNG
jgi:hypothetical protein